MTKTPHTSAHSSRSPNVTLVIPGRNTASTLRPCLDAVAPLVEQGILAEIILVDDGSTDETPEIAAQYPVRIIRGEGKGAAGARNLGWQAAKTELIWFIDADCVAEPDALPILLEQLANDDASDPSIGGVGGSYGNMRPDSLVATLIHEEIIDRHVRMPSEVSVLATFNVVYRRQALAVVGGFDPGCFWAHDAELAYRICNAGYRLRFEPSSKVGHYHPTRFFNYLSKQRKQGFYRIWLYSRHPDRMKGDSYSSIVDFIQPPLAIATLFAIMLSVACAMAGHNVWIVPAGCAVLLALMQLPMTLRILIRTTKLRTVMFAPFSYLRSFWRGIGMTSAITTLILRFAGKRSAD